MSRGPLRGRARAVLDGAARAGAPGKFVKLREGYTHYEVAGNLDGRPVVLVHGFSVPSWIWDGAFGTLARAGLRPLRYDLYGRGFSDRPPVNYDLELFTRQLAELLTVLGIEQADLVGLSMGGPIVAAYALQFSHQIGRVVLIDPSGAEGIRLGILGLVARLDGVSECLFKLIGEELLVAAFARRFFERRYIADFEARYRQQMQYDGFLRAMLSTMRNGMLGDWSPVYSRLGHQGTPVLLVWGLQDRTVPFAQSRTLLDLMPQAELLPIQDSGHIPHYERPTVVLPRLVSFLNEQRA